MPEVLPSKRLAIPQVVDENGNPVTGPEMEAVTNLVLQLAQTAQLARIRKELAKENFQGIPDHRTLSATAQLQFIDLIQNYPNTPWVVAYFFNDGPDAVYININDFYPTNPLKPGESDRIDHIRADKRIRLVYYWCDAGNTASIRVRAKF